MKSTRLRHLLFLLTSTAVLHAQSLIEQDCTIQIQSTGVKLLNWTGHVGRTYFIQSSPDLANWSWAPNIEAGENRPMSYEVDGPAKAGFFRLQYTDLTAPNLDSADFDSDGLTNLEEITQRPRPTGASLNQSLQTNSVMPVPMSTRQISRMSTRATPSQNIQTNPLKADTDDDGLNDKWEEDHQLDPTDNGSNNINNGPNGDPDQDGLDNLTEYQNGTNPFGNANTSDSDGDGILDIEDAMPGYGLVSWKRAPECNYVLIEVDSPSAYGYAEDLNDNGEVLFPDGIWSGGNWIARPPVQGIGEDPRGNEYELIPEGWLYFNANQQLLGRARLGWTGGPDEKVGGDGIPSVPTFLPSGQSTLTLLSDIQNFWNHEPRCYPIGIDSDGNMTFRISATGNATETFSTAIINKYNPSGTRIAELDGSNGFHPASSGDTSSSGWVASILRRDSSSGQSAAYKVGLWDPSDHPVTLPAEANGWGYPISAKDLPDGKFVLTAGVDNGTDTTGRIFLKNPAGQFEYATKLADKKIVLFAGDGTALTYEDKLWRNGELTPMAELCPRYNELLGDHHIFPIRSNKNGTYLIRIESTTEDSWPSKNALLLPVEVAPEVLAVNSDFDEGRIDSATGYAIPDCDDMPGVDLKTGSGNTQIALNASRAHLDGLFANDEKVTDDMHKGWFGVNPNLLGDDFWAGANVTIRKIDKIDDDTGYKESGQVRFYAKWSDGYYGISPYDFQTLQPVNLVSAGVNGNNSSVYGASSTIPDGAEFYMEGVRPGKITLEWRLQKGSIDVKHEQTFLVATQKTKQAWIDEVIYQVKLQASDLGSDIDLNDYDPANGFFLPNSNNYKYIQTVYSYYMQLFQQYPEKFYWAGMAKTAGASVYAGMVDMATWKTSVFVSNQDVDKVLIDFMIQGNKDIFMDMAWAHHAYAASGIEALDYVEENEADDVTNFDAWGLVDEGFQESSIPKLREGNKLILRREQEVVMPPLYDKMKIVWLDPGTHLEQFLATDLAGIVYPPKNAAGEINIDEMFSINSRNPVQYQLGPSLRQVVPNGKLSSFNDRWAWIDNPQNGMLQIWLGTSTSVPGFTANERSNLNGSNLTEHAKIYSMLPTLGGLRDNQFPPPPW